MKFKPGDKVITLVYEDLNGIKRFPVGTIGVIESMCKDKVLPYKVTINNDYYFYGEDEIELYNEEETAYEKGMNDAWNIAKKLFLYPDSEREAIGLVRLQEALDTMTPQEVLAKIKEYEKSFIHTGDIVKNITNGNEYIILDEGDGYAVSLDLKRSAKIVMPSHKSEAGNEFWKKTGKSVDISSLKEALEKLIIYEEN